MVNRWLLVGSIALNFGMATFWLGTIPREQRRTWRRIAWGLVVANVLSALFTTVILVAEQGA